MKNIKMVNTNIALFFFLWLLLVICYYNFDFFTSDLDLSKLNSKDYFLGIDGNFNSADWDSFKNVWLELLISAVFWILYKSIVNLKIKKGSLKVWKYPILKSSAIILIHLIFLVSLGGGVLGLKSKQLKLINEHLKGNTALEVPVLVLEIDRPDGLLDGNETLTEIKIDKINNDDEIPFSKFYLNELYVNITKKDTLIFLISKDYPDIFELRTLSGNLVN